MKPYAFSSVNFNNFQLMANLMLANHPPKIILKHILTSYIFMYK